MLDKRTKSQLLKTVGLITIGVGISILYKGMQLEGSIVEVRDDVIDAVFEIVEED